MTTAPTKEAEFKQRFVAVLQDLQEAGARDGETMALIGSLAAELAASLNQQSWSGAKSVMTTETYNDLLKTFETKGNGHHQAGRIKQAYALQALAVSLIAATQRADQTMAQGEMLLDAIIDRSVAIYRQQARSNPN
jgi:hypothetical protein